MTEEQRKRKNQRDKERRARIKAEREAKEHAHREELKKLDESLAPLAESLKSPPIAFASPLDCRVHYRGVDSDEAFFQNTMKRMNR